MPAVATAARGFGGERLNRLRRASDAMARDILDDLLEAPEIITTAHGPVLVAAITPELAKIIRDGLPDLADCEEGEDYDNG